MNIAINGVRAKGCTNSCVMCVRVGLIYSLYHSISFVYFLNELWFLMSK